MKWWQYGRDPEPNSYQLKRNADEDRYREEISREIEEIYFNSENDEY